MSYYKKMYLYKDNRNMEVVIRNYDENDIPQLIEVQKASFPPPFPSDLWWNEEQLRNHISLFPDGALCVEVGGMIVGSMTGLCVDFDDKHIQHTWEEVTDNGYIRNHNPNGNALYVVDICVHPGFRKMDLGRWLMQSMYEVVVQLDLDRLIGGGRLPGYHKVADKITAEEYVDALMKGKYNDPVTSFLLRCGRTPVGVIADYLEDEESVNYAALMEWRNPFKVTNKK
ncbi:GNAT family N-acetyltransferase [Aquibacillus koreensis]|uniref:GNAT family N-acetyltransferase n=1 Tax=Aquibacillus koreensis TaxID=279446 RepID=A0A9X3WKV9_9BACI|nr:GNAT family N-acetyltransferase [Aquibacillus koreensis]MCT2536027.1 GNAT family N-acetyltransferase [Aquibacillus koreensis]MDC3420483.1 GNAT family N-acetyltransferase [Aquibacillus koreensis]